MNQSKLTTDAVDWKSVTFKECNTHKGLLYAGDKCPVCVIEEDRDAALGRAEYDKTQLEGKIDTLEERIASYRIELGL